MWIYRFVGKGIRQTNKTELSFCLPEQILKVSQSVRCLLLRICSLAVHRLDWSVSGHLFTLMWCTNSFTSLDFREASSENIIGSLPFLFKLLLRFLLFPHFWQLPLFHFQGMQRSFQLRGRPMGHKLMHTFNGSSICCSVQSLSHVQLFATPWIAACQASLSITNSWSWPKLLSIESVRPSNHLTLCHPLLLLPSTFPSIRVFCNESTLRMRWPKYWSFSFSISPSHEHPGLISFRMDWLDLLAVQGTLKSLLQHHSSKAPILCHSAFFTVQISYPYMTTGKTIALTRWTFAGKVMSLLLNMVSRLVITFLPRSNIF